MANRSRWLWLSSASLALFSQPALADTSPREASPAPVPQNAAPVPSVPSQGPAQVGPSGGATAPETTQGLTDIIVTAQSRTESLQKAALPVAVVSGSDLLNDGVRGVQSLGKLVPSLIVEGSGQGNIIFIRGVGNFSFTANSDPAAAFNFDGVYEGRSNANYGTFYDLDRVEVLKGPQGTLYGRNATAGAINIIPVQPKLGNNSGYASASYGNYNAVQADGALNIGLGDKAAFRISGVYNRHDGYLTDGTESDNSAGGRAQLKVALLPTLTIRIEADYAQQRGAGAGVSYVDKYTQNPSTGQLTFIPSGLPEDSGLYTPAAQAYRTSNAIAGRVTGRFLDPLAPYPFQHNDVYGIASHIDWSTPIGMLTVTPAWRHASKDSINVESAEPVGEVQEANQYSIEARLVGNISNKVDYILGVYYFSEQVDDAISDSAGSLAVFNDGRYTTRSPSVYGRATFHATDWLRFTGGIRYTEDHKTYDGLGDTTLAVVCAIPTGCANAPLLPYTRYLSQQPFVPATSGAYVVAAPGVLVARQDVLAGGRLNTNKITYRGAVEADVGPHSLLYASVETGYRAGGFNTASTYAPENINAYTIGSKNRFFDGRLQLNAEAFWWKYKDQQLTYLGFDSNGVLGVLTRNVGRSTIKGAEVEAKFLVTHGLLLTTNVQYLDAKYDSFTYSSPSLPVSGCPITKNGALFTVDCSGKPALNAPKWTVNFGAEKSFDVGGDYVVTVDGDAQYRSGRYTEFEYIAPEYVNNTWLGNASVSFGRKDGRYVVSGFVRNIGNNRSEVFGLVVPASNIVTSHIGDPRTYGVRLSTKF